MSKVITFSRVFPAYHPKKGQPTYFVEKILNSVSKNNYFFVQCDKCGHKCSSQVMEGGGQIADTGDYNDILCPKCFSNEYSDINLIEDYYIGKFDPKHHTIRAGNRWKVGDKFSPRVWSGKPYQTKQIIIAPDIEVKKVWEFEVKEYHYGMGINFGNYHINVSWLDTERSMLKTVAYNDGLLLEDFIAWFKNFNQAGTYQIICWNEKIKY